ncbi:hypothetical protein Tco_0808627, partial [Tanacetum coccineum]
DGNFASTTCIICTDSYGDGDADEFTFLTLKAMAERMISIRKQLLEALIAKDLIAEQVAFMTKEYMPISIAHVHRRMQIKISTLNGIDFVIECKCTIGAWGCRGLAAKSHEGIKVSTPKIKFVKLALMPNVIQWSSTESVSQILILLLLELVCVKQK